MELDTKSRIGIVILLSLILIGLLGIYTLMATDWSLLYDTCTETLPPVPTIAPTKEPTPPPTPRPTPKPTPTPEPTPVLRQRTDLLILVNPWHEVPEDYEPELEQVTWGMEEDQYLDVRAAGPLLEMIGDCIAAGNDPLMVSGYRTMEKQTLLFENKIRRLITLEGVSWDDAPAIAAMSVAVPGTSEHQLGLAADIIDYNYPYLDEAQENMPTQKWLMEHCWDYGFILRYPNGSSEITGIIYEPWHYRYVGVEIAQESRDLGLTLEEYLETYYEPLPEEEDQEETTTEEAPAEEGIPS